MSAPQGIDEKINEITAPVAEQIVDIVFFKVVIGDAALPLIVLWLALSALFFTLYFRFINVRGMGEALRLVRGSEKADGHTGEVSHFQALATAVSGTVGIGNIGGVAIAITVGGPGATLWIILAGFMGMSTKLVECTLGVKYRNENPDGSVSGGPMYYLRRGLAHLGYPSVGKVMGGIYAVGIVVGALGIGNMFQANQAYAQLNEVSGGSLDGIGWVVGLVMAVVVFGVVAGGIRSIVRVTDKLVPLMAVLYCVFALIVIAMNASALPAAIGNIFRGAMTGEGVVGGALGGLIVGFQRAVFSNEAGIGSASIAHSAVKTDQPATEGLVSLLEPFIDTILICTISALVIGTSMAADPEFAGDAEGIAMTSAAFARTFSWFPVPLAIAAVLFAFSTMISWSYYGLKGWSYLFGEGRAGRLFYVAMFCAFVVLGASVKLGPILDISDALVFLICVPNVIGLYLLAPTVKRELASYWARDRAPNAGVAKRA